MRFENQGQIEAEKDRIKRLIVQAVQIDKDGLQVDFRAKDNLDYPEELQDALDGGPELTEAFEGLTPGRRRGYVFIFPKRSRRRPWARRVAKARVGILGGKGHHER